MVPVVYQIRPNAYASHGTRASTHVLAHAHNAPPYHPEVPLCDRLCAEGLFVNIGTGHRSPQAPLAEVDPRILQQRSPSFALAACGTHLPTRPVHLRDSESQRYKFGRHAVAHLNTCTVNAMMTESTHSTVRANHETKKNRADTPRAA